MKSYSTCIAVLVLMSIPSVWAEQPVILKSVRSGKAELRQVGKDTLFSIEFKNREIQKVPLKHDTGLTSKGSDSPYEAKVIAEIPGKLLIITDTFSSNPGNVHGECGASETGERYVHVISLVNPMRETFSFPVESCRRNLVAAGGSPKVNLSKHTMIIQFDNSESTDSPQTQTYLIAPNGSVKIK